MHSTAAVQIDKAGQQRIKKKQQASTSERPQE
jgi:hypothetical protein